MKKLILLVVLVALALVGFDRRSRNDTIPSPSASVDATDTRTLARAIANRQSNVAVQGQGTVTRVLPDDTSGSRHQRFIIQLHQGGTLLVAHNIDLANRIGALKVGDPVEFRGEYVWNPQGGLVHWTHRDPAGRHQAGWLKHNGITYQ
jgi:hypothetical protein